MGPVRMRSTRAWWAVLACAGIVCGAGACDAPVSAPASDHYAAYAEIVAEEDARGGIGLARTHAHLAGDSPALRALAVRALGRLEDPGRVERIAPLLDDAEGGVREAAVHALAQAVYGSDPGAVARVLAERIGTEADPSVLGAIAISIGRLAFGTAAARGEADAALVAVSERLPVVEEDPGLVGRVGLARGIEAFARSDQAGGTGGAGLSAALAGVAASLAELGVVAGGGGGGGVELTAARVRRLAMGALVHSNQLGAEAAKALMQDEDWGVRRQVVAAAARHGVEAEVVIPAGLADPDPRVRVEALAAYDRRLRPGQGCAPIIAAMNDVDPDVINAAIGLAARPCPDLDAQREVLGAKIAELEDAGAGWRAPSRALHALAAIAPGEVGDETRAFATHTNPFVRGWAARAAAEAGSEAVLAELASDPVANVREAALRGLGAVEGARARDAYLAQLDADDPQLVMTATRLLVEHAAAETPGDALLAALARFTARQRETERDVRVALLEAIGAVGGFESDALTPYLTDFDPAVADRAAALLTEATGTTHEAAPRPLPRAPTPDAARLTELERSNVVLHMAGLGEIVVALRPDLGATNADRFARLAATGQLDGRTFHRVEPNFVIQGGSPNANEYSGEGPYSRDEIGSHPHWRGTVGLSTRGRDTGDGQIFVNLADNLRLDFNYTIYGVVAEGMEVVDAVQEGAVIERAEVTAALTAAREAALSENSGFQLAEDHVSQRRLGRLSFDSSDLPDSPIYDVVGGLFLPGGGVALVDRAEIHLVDLVSGRTRTVGREGEGPEEFRYISRVNRTLEGILVWDMPRRRASVVGHDGELLRSRDYRQVPFQDYFSARPVAVHPDGRIIFRDGVDSGFGDYEGRIWNPAKYLAVEPEGELRLVSEAKGDELFYGPTRTSKVVFGHRTFEAATEDGLIIADTHRGVIAVLDWNGAEVAEISMPPGVQLTDAQTVGREFLARQSEELEERLNRAASAGQIPPGRAQSFRDALAAHDPKTMAWPINEVLPAIDTLLADFDARLWARDYRLPGQDSVNWRVWDVAKAQTLFTVRMDGEDILLDAKGDLVLLRRLDVFDVPRAVVVRLESGAG